MITSNTYHGTAAAPAISDSIEAARALRNTGQIEEALRVLTGPIKLSAEFYILRGDLQLEMNMLEDAEESYAAAIVSEPDNLCGHYNLGVCLRRAKQWARAAECFEKVLDYDPHRDHVRVALGECLLNLANPAEALAQFDQCWSQPERLRVLFGKAAALQLLRRFDEAESLYKRVLELDPKAAEALSNLIAMSMEVFDLDRVQRYAQQLLQIEDNSAIALQALTVVALERRELPTASHHFNQLIGSGDTNRSPWHRAPSDAVEYRLGRGTIEALNKYRLSRKNPGTRSSRP